MPYDGVGDVEANGTTAPEETCWSPSALVQTSFGFVAAPCVYLYSSIFGVADGPTDAQLKQALVDEREAIKAKEKKWRPGRLLLITALPLAVIVFVAHTILGPAGLVCYVLALPGCVIWFGFAFQWLLIQLLLQAIKRLDKRLVGTQIDIWDLHLNLCAGRVQIGGMHVHNPPGYRSKYVLRMEHVGIDLNIWRIVRSLGGVIEVSELEVRGVKVIVEKTGTWLGMNPGAVQSNVSQLVEFFKTQAPPLNEIEPVYEFYHTKEGRFTYHLLPAWGGEERRDAQFFVYTCPVPGTVPVHAYFHNEKYEHRFHCGEPEEGETKRKIHYYAFPSEEKRTYPVSVFTVQHAGKVRQTLHFGGPRSGETQGKVAFYAYKKDPTRKSKVEKARVPLLKPVHNFWHSSRGEFSVHFPPAWPGEAQRKIMFYAFDMPKSGMEPVYSFWSERLSDHTFHLGDAREGEVKQGVEFYAYPKQVKGTQAVRSFWHEWNQKHTHHMGGPWGGETVGPVEFYAYKSGSMKDPPLCYLRKVELDDIRAKAFTDLIGTKMVIEDVRFTDMSTETGCYTIEEVVNRLVHEVLNKVYVRFT